MSYFLLFLYCVFVFIIIIFFLFVFLFIYMGVCAKWGLGRKNSFCGYNSMEKKNNAI